MRLSVTAACLLVCSFSSPQTRADSCKPDVSRVDKITKQQQEIWTQKVGGTGFGASLMGSTDMAIFVTVGRYGGFNAVNVEILKEEASGASASFDSALHAVKGNRFFLGFKEGGEPLTFVATDVGNSTKVRNDVLDFGKGKVVTTVVLSSAVSDETLAAMRTALTTKQIDAIRVFLVGDLRVEQSIDDKSGKKLMAKFLCFFEAMDKRGPSRPATQGQSAAEQAPANDPARMAVVQGRYARKGKPSDFLELNADGTSGLLQDGQSVRGNYTVLGNTISFTSPEMPGLTSKSQVTGDTIKDDEGIIWEKMTEAQRAAAPPLPKASEAGPSKASAASLPGRYVLKGSPSNFIEIKADGKTVETQIGGRSGVGTYVAKGDKFHFEVKKGASGTFRVKDNALLGTTQVWEKQVAEAPRVAPVTTAPVTLRLGMTPEEVELAQGARPQKVIDLGGKKIFVYSDMKITFVDGKVTDVQ